MSPVDHILGHLFASSTPEEYTPEVSKLIKASRHCRPVDGRAVGGDPGRAAGAITFIESLIVDQTCRELLYQLNEVAALEGLTMSWENRTRLSYVAESLKRMWGSAG